MMTDYAGLYERLGFGVQLESQPVISITFYLSAIAIIIIYSQKQSGYLIDIWNVIVDLDIAFDQFSLYQQNLDRIWIVKLANFKLC